MANYIGVKCPVCSKKFTQTDDIVVCPVCGAPHHRACYAEQGECVFQGEHLSGKEWHAPKEEIPAPESSQDAAVKECPRCGGNNPSDSLFCQICGTRIGVGAEGQNAGGQAPGYGQQPGGNHPGSGQQQGQQGWPFAGGCGGTQFDSESFRYGGVSPDSTIGGEKARDIATYVGSNTAYFMPRFQMFSDGVRIFSINLSALVFNFFYFFYRKMYVVGAILLTLSAVTMIPWFLYMREMLPEVMADPKAANLLLMLEEMGTPYTLTPADIDYARASYFHNVYSILWNVKMVVRFAAAIFANMLYYKHAVTSVHTVRENLGGGVEPARYCAVLTYRGGVSSLSIISGIVIAAVAYLAIGCIVLNNVFY